MEGNLSTIISLEVDFLDKIRDNVTKEVVI
jgi:hypothetical protein